MRGATRWPKQQRGSITDIALMLFIGGLLLTTVLKLAPVYLDHRVIVDAMEAISTGHDPGSVRISAIREELRRTLEINNIKLDSSAVSLTREQGRQEVRISYETRVHMFYNISVVVAFDDRFPIVDAD